MNFIFVKRNILEDVRIFCRLIWLQTSPHLQLSKSERLSSYLSLSLSSLSEACTGKRLQPGGGGGYGARLYDSKESVGLFHYTPSMLT